MILSVVVYCIVLEPIKFSHLAKPYDAIIMVTLLALIAGGIGLYLLIFPMIEHFGDMESDTHGTARFSLKRETKLLTKHKQGLLIGRDVFCRKILRYAGPAHLMTIAPTRSGKGVGTVIPNLLMQDRSIICIDPKGENAKTTMHMRAQFGAVHILDPYGISGKAKHLLHLILSQLSIRSILMLPRM